MSQWVREHQQYHASLELILWHRFEWPWDHLDRILFCRTVSSGRERSNNSSSRWGSSRGEGGEGGGSPPPQSLEENSDQACHRRNLSLMWINWELNGAKSHPKGTFVCPLGLFFPLLLLGCLLWDTWAHSNRRDTSWCRIRPPNEAFARSHLETWIL